MCVQGAEAKSGDVVVARVHYMRDDAFHLEPNDFISDMSIQFNPNNLNWSRFLIFSNQIKAFLFTTTAPPLYPAVHV